MKGIRHIKVRLPKISYELVLERKVTILKGNSATGKTTFIDLINRKIKK
jgi:ABC-type proline/glycine betaine transport system ATPase subunit